MCEDLWCSGRRVESWAERVLNSNGPVQPEPLEKLTLKKEQVNTRGLRVREDG
jgi:hypothetical protein